MHAMLQACPRRRGGLAGIVWPSPHLVLHLIRLGVLQRLQGHMAECSTAQRSTHVVQERGRARTGQLAAAHNTAQLLTTQRETMPRRTACSTSHLQEGRAKLAQHATAPRVRLRVAHHKNARGRGHGGGGGGLRSRGGWRWRAGGQARGAAGGQCRLRGGSGERRSSQVTGALGRA
jgi:hypothetical protein